jgi:hypothetical protein
MAAPAPVAGSHSTFAAGPEASRGQIGQTMLQVTPPNKALRLTASLLGAAPLASKCPDRERGGRRN